jgi:ADP-ribosylglycohydrolase
VRGALPSGIQDRFRGSLFGGAIGDAMGSAFEFISSSAIAASNGGPIVRDYREALPGSLMHPRVAGRPTDDTAMTLALLESLAQGAPPLSIESLHRGICDALAPGNNPASTMFWDGGPGGACIAMLRVAQSGAGPFERLNPNAGGNGAAMRAHVCGLFPDRAFVAELGALQARLSHPHPAAVACAQAIALIAHEGFYTGKLATELPPEVTDPQMLAAWTAAHRDLKKGARLPAHLRDVDMAGWNTVSAAHAIAYLYSDDVEAAIGIAAGSGGDTDTVASMVGAMLGAVHGCAALPQRWIDGLHERELLEPWPERMQSMARGALALAQPFVITP